MFSFCFKAISRLKIFGRPNLGQIPDDQITSSLPDSLPHHGRLHNPVSAWCFLYSKALIETGFGGIDVDPKLTCNRRAQNDKILSTNANSSFSTKPNVYVDNEKNP